MLLLSLAPVLFLLAQIELAQKHFFFSNKLEWADLNP